LMCHAQLALVGRGLQLGGQTITDPGTALPSHPGWHRHYGYPHPMQHGIQAAKHPLPPVLPLMRLTVSSQCTTRL
jgi:hypothetical protein